MMGLHGLNILLSGFNYSAIHEFIVPYEGYARIKIELINKDLSIAGILAALALAFPERG